MKLNRQFIYRVLIYVLGLVFLAFSVAFAINSDLGISPVNSLPYAISLVSGAKLSTCVICVFSADHPAPQEIQVVQHFPDCFLNAIWLLYRFCKMGTWRFLLPHLFWAARNGAD